MSETISWQYSWNDVKRISSFTFKKRCHWVHKENEKFVHFMNFYKIWFTAAQSLDWILKEFWLKDITVSDLWQLLKSRQFLSSATFMITWEYTAIILIF